MKKYLLSLALVAATASPALAATHHRAYSDNTAKAAPVAGGCTTSGPTPQGAESRCTTTPPPVKPGSSTVTATVHAIFALQ